MGEGGGGKGGMGTNCIHTTIDIIYYVTIISMVQPTPWYYEPLQ